MASYYSIGSAPTSGNWDACLISSRQSISTPTPDAGVPSSTEFPCALKVGGVSDRGTSWQRLRRNVSSRRRSWRLVSQEQATADFHGRVEGKVNIQKGSGVTLGRNTEERSGNNKHMPGHASGCTPFNRIVLGEISSWFLCSCMAADCCWCLILHRCFDKLVLHGHGKRPCKRT